MQNGQYKLRWSEEEIRFEGEPFPLFPGESLVVSPRPLQLVAQDKALHLRATRSFDDLELGVSRNGGDEWLFRGPGTYVPRVEVEVLNEVSAVVIKKVAGVGGSALAPTRLQSEALRLRAHKSFSRDGVVREVGEEYLVRTVGAYMPEVEEEVVGVVKALLLTRTVALHLTAIVGTVLRVLLTACSIHLSTFTM